MVSGAFLLANGVLVAGQAALVALPGRGVPAPLERFRSGGWALLAGACVLAVVAAALLGPGAATALSRLALAAVPLLAAAALAWAMRGARPACALLAPALFALAWWRVGSVAGDAAAAVLSALSCVTLARLLAGVVPAMWLKAALLVWAVCDAVTVFGNEGHPPDATVDAAVPAAGLPHLQWLDLHAASLGYADVFVAAVLGAVLAAERVRAWPVALAALAFSVAFDSLFLAFDTLPATVPIALALLASEAARKGGRRPPRPADGSSLSARRRTAAGARRVSPGRPTTTALRAASIAAMPMSRILPLRRTASLGLVATTLLIAGCGSAPDRDAPAGTTVTQDGVAYSVQTSRALNPLDPDDRALLQGVRHAKRLEGPDSTLLGVFLQASDQASGPRRAVAAPELVDAFGRVYRPLAAPARNPLAYRGGRLQPGQQIPNPDSDAAEGPENGAAVIYRVPSDVFLTDRPFTLRFGGHRAASVQLDV